MQKQIQNDTNIVTPLESNFTPDNKVILSLGDTKEKSRKIKKRKGTKKQKMIQKRQNTSQVLISNSSNNYMQSNESGQKH
jgi:hypothetical protein